MRPVLICLMAALAAACSGDDLVLPHDTGAARLTLVGGDGQSGAVGTALPESLAVLVSDATGRPAMGHRVVFAVVSGDGAELAPEIATTGTDGRASASWVLGREPGTQRARAEISGETTDGLEPVVFTASASAGSAALLSMVSGDDQTAPAGSPLPDSLVVRVQDRFGNPVGGVRVAWAAAGGGLVSPSQVTTGGNGRAATRRVLGSATGNQSATATVSGIDGSPVFFSHTATGSSGGGGGGGGGGGSGGGGGNDDDRVVRIAFIVQPSDAEDDERISPAVRVAALNSGGSTVTSASGEVEITLGDHPKKASLKGDRTRSLASGVATFSDLRVDGSTGNYTLVASLQGVADVESAPFRIED